jgi:ABC-type multidrug transport system ATPase subunit/pSer/pThr/pTyr-binding forkhead associated (FHA) protein
MAAAGILEVQRPGTRRAYALDGRPVSLGRAPDNTVVLDHASVSRYHARIEWREAQPLVADLGSANGTRVNDAAISPNVAQPLALGDRIQILDFELTLREPAAGQAERRDVSGRPLPSVEPALLTHAEPASVSLLVNTQHRAEQYPIEEASVTIGRDPANDICIDEPVVSWRHARLERVANGYQIVDLDSSNGLTCQDVEVAEMLLADGDELWIASDVRLTYRITPLAPEEDTPGLEEATPSPAERPALEKAPAPRAAEAPVFKRVEPPAPAAETPVFERLSPPPPPAEKPAVESAVPVASWEAVREEAVPLHATLIGMETPSSGLHKIDMRERSELTIGRSPENDLQLSYPTISRHHARIRRVGGGEAYVIEDLGSSNGTVVNDALIEPGELHPLQPGSTLRIGPIKLIFAPHAMQLVDESRDLRLDALHLNQFVGKDINLLQDISLAILPREFVALVGVSGAGKSTLMNALAGFWPASDGVVLVNGTDLYRRFDVFRTDLGYVPQDDIIHKELTAEKALDYAARLRLPPDTTAAERKEAVAAELEILGLTERKDVRVGSLSGGQRKRVSIGVERLTRPGLFFLDEATSGLDPGTENRLMRLLRQLADDGQTIVLITHATKNVTLCDQVIFLAAGGQLAYFGPPDEALAYFGVAAFDEIYEQLEEERSPEVWAEMYRQSPQYREYVVKRLRVKYGELLDARPESPAFPAPKTKVKRPPPLRQFGVLAARYLDIVRADRVNLLLMLLIAPVLGAMDLIAWPRETYDPVEGDAARAMVMVFLAVIIPFLIGALGSVREVVKERAIYRRERTVNLRIVPYLLSKVAVGFLFALYTAAALLILKLISVDFSHLGMGDVALVYLILLLAVVSGVMWGLLISAIAPREEQAMLLLIVIVVVQMVFSGGILPLDQLGTAGDVIGGITSSKWTFEAMVDVTQVQRGDCDGPSLGNCELAGVQAYETDAERRVVITHLEDRYGHVLEGDVTTSIAALLGILVGLFILLAVIQKRKDVI